MMTFMLSVVFTVVTCFDADGRDATVIMGSSREKLMKKLFYLGDFCNNCGS